MKRPLQLSLAIALALGVTDAFALGLGAIQVRSGLNQPLNAEIPVIVSSPTEADGLIVQIASADDFDRVGLSRSSVSVPIQVGLSKNARGETIIRLTSEDPVRDPFLGLLLEANWPKGRLLREYTVLLDPPVMAPAVKGASAVAVAAADSERAATQPLPAPAPARPAAPPPRPAQAAAPAPAAKPAAPTPAPSAPPAARVASAGEYGPVAAGETLGEIARATRPGENVSVNQMMLALLKHNPNAFFQDNINALKRGAVLRIPSAEEVAATGSAREAAAAARSQIEEWRGGLSTTPTRIADTGAAPVPASPTDSARPTTPRATGERLALVPPREGSASQSAADRPAGGTPGGTGDAATRAELARVKEALTSREQESGELRSRVRDLEDMRDKNTRLISLQSSELAELREKLRKLQEDAAKAAAAPQVTAVPPAPTPAAASPVPAVTPAEPASTSPPVVTAADIWGDAEKAASTQEPPGALPEATPTVAPVEPVAPPGDAIFPAQPDPAVTDIQTAPLVDAAPPTPAVQLPVPAADVKPVVAPVPARSTAPWYLESWALGAAGVGGLLLVLLGLAGLRKRKPVGAAAGRASIAEAFGDSPIGAGRASAVLDGEEEALIEQVRDDPSNAGAHLELLSLYYANRDTAKFEAAAEEMYAYVADPNQPEWREARSMGEELVPHNPLFGGESELSDFAGDGYAETSPESGFSFDDVAPAEATEFEDFRFDEPPASPAALTDPLKTSAFQALPEAPPAPAFDFDLGQTSAPPSRASVPDDSAFNFDDLPPIDSPRTSAESVLDDGPRSAAAIDDDEFFAGEDAIGTKLDLAKAYLDMGDPEGARSMLEEVLAEGSDSQQAEARKLIAEIG